MRRYILALVLMVPLFLYSGQTSIYDIQFTNNSGNDGTYPSLYRNQVVTVSGIVTAVNRSNGGFYLSEPEGGPWRGIFVNDRTREVRTGDMVELTGEVAEHFGFTIIRNLRRLNIISSGNQLPPPVPVTTRELATSEAYEGVLVQVTNVRITGRGSQEGAWLINDGTGNARLAEGFMNSSDQNVTVKAGDSLARVIGVVDYRFGEYRLNSRQASDIHFSSVGASKPSWGRIKSYYR